MGAIAVVASAYVGAGGAGAAAFSWGTFGLGLLPLFASEFGPAQKGPRLDNLQVGGNDYGRPIPQGYGTFSTAGNLVWAAPIKERAQKHGKFGQPKYTEYTYYGTFLQMFCAGPTTGKTIRLKRLWAVQGDNEILLYDVASNPPTVNPFEPQSSGYYITYDDTTGIGTGTWGGDATAGEIFVYTGTDNQTPWSVIESYEGAGSAPAYVNRVCVGLVNYPLANFGNAIPPLRAEWTESSTTIADICDGIAERVANGLTLFDPATDCDFSALNGDALSSTGIAGFICDSAAPAAQYLDQVRTAYKVDFPDIDNQIVAVKRGGSSILTLTEDDLGWHEFGSETPPIIDDKIAIESSIPSQFDLAFLDIDRDSKPSTQPAQRQTVLSENKTTFSLGFVMKSSLARAIVEMNLAEAWVGRNVPTGASSWEYIWLAPTDPITLTRGSEQITVLLLDTHIRLFGPQDLSMVEYDRTIYTQAFTGEAAPLDSAQGMPAGAPIYQLFESNALDDADVENPGFYVAATRPYSSAWSPLRFMENSPIATLSNAISPNSIPRLSRATIGTATTALGNHAGGSATWDEVNTVTVDLDYGTLSSAAEEDVLAGANTAVLGAAGRWEVFRFTDATYVGTFSDKKRYTLSGKLWRGLRGTESFISTHTNTDKFVLIDAAVERIEVGSAWLNVPKTWVFRDNTAIETKGNLASTSLTITGVSMKPFSPAYLSAIASGSDVAITWEKRYRYEDVSILSGVPPTNAPYDVDVYKVEIYSGSTLKRTLSDVLTVTNATYTAAQIAADGFTTGQTITIKVAQSNTKVGWGYTATTTVLAP